MKKLYLIILIPTLLLNACANIDLSPDYSGTYAVATTEEYFKNGKLLNTEEGSGNLKISHGPNEKTVMFNVFTDKSNNMIEMPIKLGFFSFDSKDEYEGCPISQKINGQLDGGTLKCTYTITQKCKTEEISVVTKISGFRK